jgi:putative FmdB family regulatory protein
MPTYEFRCPMGHEFEKFYRSIGAAPSEVTCPTCGKVAERQMSAAGLVFKGSGFYITDYGKDGKKSQAASPPAEGSKGATESGGAKNESGASDSRTSPEQKSPAPTTPESKTSAPKSEASKPSGKTKSGE